MVGPLLIKVVAAILGILLVLLLGYAGWVKMSLAQYGWVLPFPDFITIGVEALAAEMN